MDISKVCQTSDCWRDFVNGQIRLPGPHLMQTWMCMKTMWLVNVEGLVQMFSRLSKQNKQPFYTERVFSHCPLRTGQVAFHCTAAVVEIIFRVQQCELCVFGGWKDLMWDHNSEFCYINKKTFKIPSQQSVRVFLNSVLHGSLCTSRLRKLIFWTTI